MLMNNGDLLELTMQENGEFAVTEIERAGKDGQVRSITEKGHGRKGVPRTDDGHGDRNHKAEPESKERDAGDSAERKEREGSNQSRSAVHSGEAEAEAGRSSREVKELKKAGIAVDTEAGVVERWSLF